MKLYIVRHGETDWNKKRRIQGQVDIPLNDFGRSLARKTAKGLSGIPFEVCYTSPLGRAKETARLILEGRKTPILEDQRIIEMSFGDYEGKCCSKSNWELPEKFRRFFDDPVHYEAPCGGEDFIDVRERTGEFLKDICGRGQLSVEQHINHDSWSSAGWPAEQYPGRGIVQVLGRGSPQELCRDGSGSDGRHTPDHIRECGLL